MGKIMKTKRYLALTIALVLLIALFPVTAWNQAIAAPANDTVDISDPAFLAYLNSELDESRPSDTPITREEMASFTSIDTRWTEESISSIKGISAAVNLKRLAVSGDITGLEDIAALENLTSLTVTENENVEDLSFLGEKPNLTSLSVGENPNMTSLQGLTSNTCPSLSVLDLSLNSNLADISALDHVAFPGLTKLDLGDSSAISSISALCGYTALTDLNLEKVKITEENREDYRNAVASLTALKSLYMPYCGVTDADAEVMFAPLSQLKTLVLNVNDLTSVDFVDTMSANLTTLGLYGNEITDMDSLKKFQDLKTLGFSGNHVTDFSFISALPQLGNGSIRHEEGTESFPFVSQFQVGDPSDRIELGNGTLTIENPYVQPNGEPISFAEALPAHVLGQPDDSGYTISYDEATNEITLENVSGDVSFYVNYQLPASNGKFKVCKLFINVYADHQHTWSATTYTWAEDGSSCTASRVCEDNAAHVEQATAVIDQQQTKEPTCTQAGETTYTATFDQDWAVTQTMTLADVAKLSHSYSQAWQWDDTSHFHSCELCGEKADAAAHTFQWVTDTQAGEKYQKCTVCGYQLAAEPLPTASPAPSATPNPAPSATPAPSQPPQTGDTSSVLLWISALAMCSVLLPALIAWKRNVR